MQVSFKLTKYWSRLASEESNRLTIDSSEDLNKNKNFNTFYKNLLLNKKQICK